MAVFFRLDNCSILFYRYLAEPGKTIMTTMNQPPVFCEKYCVICKGARAGNFLCKALQNLELTLLGKNGCFWGKARTRYYGVAPDQKIPDDFDSKNTNQ